MMQTYRYRPVPTIIVEADQWQPGKPIDSVETPDGWKNNSMISGEYGSIGRQDLKPGDWVIYWSTWKSVCPLLLFDLLFEPVEAAMGGGS